MFHRNKSVDFSEEIPLGNSTEMKPWSFLWNFHTAHECSPVVIWAGDATKQSLFPQICLCGTFCGNSTRNFTDLCLWNSLWKFHGKFNGFVSVEIPQNVPPFCVGLLGYCNKHELEGPQSAVGVLRYKDSHFGLLPQEISRDKPMMKISWFNFKTLWPLDHLNPASAFFSWARCVTF